MSTRYIAAKQDGAGILPLEQYILAGEKKNSKINV